MESPKYHQDHTWSDAGDPCVTVHDNCVSLHTAGFNFPHRHGYGVHFQPRHLPKLRKLVAALEAMEQASDYAPELDEAAMAGRQS